MKLLHGQARPQASATSAQVPAVAPARVGRSIALAFGSVLCLLAAYEVVEARWLRTMGPARVHSTQHVAGLLAVLLAAVISARLVLREWPSLFGLVRTYAGVRRSSRRARRASGSHLPRTFGHMTIGRRDFLRSGLLVAGGAAAGAATAGIVRDAAAAAPPGPRPAATLALTRDGELVVAGATTHTPDEARKGIPGRRWLMVIDLAACDGCGLCSQSCSRAHFIPSDREWMRIYRMQESPESAPYWMPRPCFQCDDPPCTRVCPVGATFKRDDGIVLIDNTRCIGCRFCMAACPYSVRTFNWSRPLNSADASARGYSPEWGYPRRVGTAEKCDFCVDMARDGKLPHCVSACPMGALYFGDGNEDAVTNSRGDTVRLSKLLRDRAGYRQLEELGTHPRVWYLPPYNRHYPAPGEPGARPVIANGGVQR